ncbi:unnamed protein product [Cuscuta campestris]|uniref:Reverse transcriptase zinc-binding domain-containing protein n=1 Tax=Cuscuta campestris TaxID=132261 RepID=A0A484LSV0_9ASTE|nr:unnamed protein product [Cuscuta campestris]
MLSSNALLLGRRLRRHFLPCIRTNPHDRMGSTQLSSKTVGRRKQVGKVGWVGLKLDMAKAYDRVSWTFVETMMRTLGFSEAWIQLIMMCVKSVRYRVLVNGTLSEVIAPTRGLICAEGLSLLLKKAEVERRIHGVRVANGAPPISHLFFADDSLLLFKASMEEARVVKQCLEEYELASGQQVNFCPDIFSIGVYPVKSAYKKLTGEAADTSFFNHWSRLWKLNVEPKVKVCFWRALRDILPVACSLKSKGIQVDTLCRSCGSAEESVTHVFVACPVAQRLWRVLGVKVVNNQGLCFDSLLHWADFNFGSRVGREMDCMAAGIWALWKARNMANLESKLPTVGIIEAWTREAVASTPSNCSGSKAPVAEARISGITCSVDAAVFENARRVGVGAILIGEDNSFIGAFNSCINCPLEPRIAETMAIKEALSWIKDHGFSERGGGKD